MDQIGKYQVLDKIGAGGFAVVYKGYDPFIKRPVAIKVCFSRDAETRERFHREAEIAGRLVHRNITAVYDFGVHEEMPYLVEEYLPGEDLAHMIRRREPETLDEKLEVLLQIAGGLGYAHSQHVIHRDIKPSNIRILDSGRVKIMDFGTAKLANVESSLTQTGMTLGTVAYLSPERLVGRDCGTNSDIFSYGVLAYELLSFRRPFSGPNIPGLIDQVIHAAPVPLVKSWSACPPSLAAVVHQCLAKDPVERYAACEQIITDLEQVRAEHGAPIPDAALAPAAAAGADLRLSGILDHARELHRRGEYRRAEALLAEVLEIDPGHAAARRLRAVCRDGVAGDGVAGDADAAARLADDARAGSQETQTLATPTGVFAGDRPTVLDRKTREAVDSIERLLADGDPATAAEALRFAVSLFGEFEQLPRLRRRIRQALRSPDEAS